jgi:hypothetical protein
MAFQRCDTTRLLLDIDRGLEMFGNGVKEVVYYRMNATLKMNRMDIPQKPQEFVSFLEEMFGPGFATVEKSIIRAIAEDFGFPACDSLSSAIVQAKVRIFESDVTV